MSELYVYESDDYPYINSLINKDTIEKNNQKNKKEYNENNTEEFGVIHKWQNAKIIESIITQRGTHIEMVERPKWGIACYMNNSIQSCEKDEVFYHESLVHPVMSVVELPKRVCIIGGGEGATAREVLKWNGVEEVDMYEWDEEVVNVFRKKYKQWGKQAWNDRRLKIHFEDIFEVISRSPKTKYDVIIIDLFEPTEENQSKWDILIGKLQNWIQPQGAICMYAGMRSILTDIQPYEKLISIINATELWRGIEIPKCSLNKEIVPYRVWIPSFSGESMFLLLQSQNSKMNFDKIHEIHSHITESIWNSYKTLNW